MNLTSALKALFLVLDCIFQMLELNVILTLFAHKACIVTFTLLVFIAFNMYCFVGRHWVEYKIY